MKRVLTAMALGAVILAPLSQSEANDKLLDILKSKGVITDEQYEDLAKESKKEMKAFYKDGFKLESGEKNFSLEVSGRVESDFRYFANNNANDTFDIRRAFLAGSGTVYKYWGYKVELDFGGGSASLKDVFVSYNYFPNAQIKVGQFYYPFGNEQTSSDRFYEFLEPSSIIAAITPGRDRGIEVNGNPWGGLVHYEVGVFSGAGENKSNANYAAGTKDDFDYAARVVINPTAGSKGPFQAWVGASGGYGQQAGLNSNDISVATESKSGNKYFAFAIPTTQNYNRTRMGAEATFLFGPAMLKGEYLQTNYDFASKKADVKGGYVSAGCFLTDDQRTVKNGQTVRQSVKKPFDIDKGQWGAWEVAARYSWFQVDDKFFTANALYSGQSAASATGYADKGKAWTAGINWYPNKMTRVYADWVHSTADNNISGGTSKIFTKNDGNKSDSEDAFIMRVQVEF